MNDKDLKKLLDLAKDAALAAGEIINSSFGMRHEIEHKEGGTSLASKIVTEVDRQAEAAILEILNPTRKNYNLGLLTEETPDDKSRFEQDHFWCIDHLDGTLPFSRGESGFSTSIALVSKKGEVLIGAVFDPHNKDLYFAQKDRGAFKNGSSLKAKKINEEVTIIDGPGGAVMQAITTINAAPCIFYKRPKEEEGGGCLWDYAATSLIHSEAGGINNDFNFQAFDFNSKKSLYMNHCGVLYYVGISKEELGKHIQF